MGKLVKSVMICLLVVACIWCGALIADRNKLREELIRLHIVAHSDSEEDQTVKLQVRDAVIKSLEAELRGVADIDQAKQYLLEHLDQIQAVANRTLEDAGIDMTAVVSLCREAFDTRVYDTFTLPAGIYNALRITIGEGKGQNWWCVVFPSLCVSATAEGFTDTAVEAGFSNALTGTLTGEKGYEIRFYLLDTFGRLENIFFAG